MAPSPGVVDALLQRSLRMRIRLGRAPKLHASADIVSAGSAVLAVLAGQTNFQGHTIPRRQVRHVGANGDNRSAGFMAQCERLADNDVAVSIVVEVVQVRAA